MDASERKNKNNRIFYLSISRQFLQLLLHLRLLCTIAFEMRFDMQFAKTRQNINIQSYKFTKKRHSYLVKVESIYFDFDVYNTMEEKDRSIYRWIARMIQQ